MTKIGIYRILCLVNDKGYIGQSTHLRKRKGAHFLALKKNIHINGHLQRAFNKYGKNNFKFEILEECSIEKLDEREKYYISLYDTINEDKGYNIRPETTTNLGFHHSEETKQKMRELLTGRIVPEEEKKAMSEGRKKLFASGYKPPYKPMGPIVKAKFDAFREARKKPLIEKICTCGCGGTFFVKVYNSQRQYVNKEHWLRVSGVAKEERICLCGCGITFMARITSKKRFLNKEHGYKSTKHKNNNGNIRHLNV